MSISTSVTLFSLQIEFFSSYCASFILLIQDEDEGNNYKSFFMDNNSDIWHIGTRYTQMRHVLSTHNWFWSFCGIY